MTVCQVVFTAVCQAKHAARSRSPPGECWARSGPAKCHTVTRCSEGCYLYWMMTAIKSPQVRKSQRMNTGGQNSRSSKAEWVNGIWTWYPLAVCHVLSLCLAFCCLHPGTSNLEEKNPRSYTELISLGLQWPHRTPKPCQGRILAKGPHSLQNQPPPVTPPASMPSHPHLPQWPICRPLHSASLLRRRQWFCPIFQLLKESFILPLESPGTSGYILPIKELL